MRPGTVEDKGFSEGKCCGTVNWCSLFCYPCTWWAGKSAFTRRITHDHELKKRAHDVTYVRSCKYVGCELQRIHCVQPHDSIAIGIATYLHLFCDCLHTPFNGYIALPTGRGVDVIAVCFARLQPSGSLQSFKCTRNISERTLGQIDSIQWLRRNR